LVNMSSSVVLKNNFILDHLTYGVQLNGVQNSVVDGNVIANISRAREEHLNSEPTGGLIMGSFTMQDVPIRNTSVINNIVAGVEWAGYTALASPCGLEKT